MKIFVTGITGFVGGAIANYFASIGYEITGISRSGSLPPHISKKCSYIQADICLPLPDINADIVIHAAGLASHTASFKELFKVNVQGTKHVLAAAKNLSHFVYVSSSSVYNFTDHAMKENEAGANYIELSDYGKSKYLAEQYLLNRHNGFKISILRPRAIYGKHDHTLLPKMIRLIKGNKLFLPAHLSKKISLTHIDNFIQAIELCTLLQTDTCEVFNIADKEVYDLHQILTTLLPLVAERRLHTVTIPAILFDLFVAINSRVKLNPSLNRFAADSLTRTAVINTDKIRQELDYNPSKNFHNCYPEIAQWMHHEEGPKNLLEKINSI